MTRLNRCIRIDLNKSAPDEHGKRYRLTTDERAGTLLDLKACAEQVKASIDMTEPLFPKVFVDDGLADHRALRETLHEYGKQAELIVIGA